MDVKERKLLKQHSRDIVEDRISKLPRNALLHILSFLTTKCVVSTSILSTKWRYLWKFVSCLHFTGTRISNQELVRKAMNSVDRVFFFRDLSNITKFILDCGISWDSARINTWISLIVRHKLEELILNVDNYISSSYSLPPSLFLCESLTILKIVYGGLVKLPSSISFPSLKVLELTYLEFSDGNLTENFASCPSLKELVIKNCKWVGILSKISISNPALKRLVIDCSDGKGLNIDYLKMHAPSLVFLSWVSEYFPIECNLSVMPSLASAVVLFKNFYEDKSKEEMGIAASNLLGGISHVRSLKISAQIFSHAKDLSDHIPQFENLFKVEVDKDCSFRFTSALLLLPRISPRLEIIVFKAKRPYYGEGEEDWELDIVPQSSLLHLKKVIYSDLAGYPVELAAVKYFLENAIVLEVMCIGFYWELSDAKSKKARVLEKLLRMRRASNRCVVSAG
ncbi:hypothetical protein ACHQM5_011367 [Ranunculus cassubicifolius]